MNGTPITPDPHLHHPRDYKPCEPSYPSPSRPSGVDGGYQAQRVESRLSRARSMSHRSVGPKRNNAHNTEDSDGDHPMDTPGEETGENARIWKVYLFEAEKADSALADGCNRSMDVLLVFTGLFSAVLTTFIIQSYQLMIPSPTDTTNILLTRLISLHDSNLTSSVPSGGPTTPSREIHWVNGLWFAALSCSLSTALMSMLAKQWVQAYTPNVSGSPRLRARQRQLKYMQLEIWHVIPIINALPLFLHVALLLFFAGLVVLLWTTDIGTTIATLIIVLLAYLFYFVSIWLSVLDPDCPYQHPISEHIRKWITRNHPRRKAPGDLSTTSSRSLDLEGAIAADAGSPKLCNERLANDKLDASALLWLLERSSDSVVISTALQAIAGLPRDFSSLPILHGANAVSRVEESFRRCFYIDTSVDVQWHLLDPEGAGLYCRAWLRLTRGTNEKWPSELLEPILILQDVETHPDCAAIASCAVALSSPNSHLPQWKLISCLVMYSTGETHLNPSTLCWLLDSLVECAIRWEMATSVIDRTTHRGVPAFLRLLQSTQDKPLWEVRYAVAFALYVFTGGPVKLADCFDEEKRHAGYFEFMLMALSKVIANTTKFGIPDDLLSVVAQELIRLGSPAVARLEKLPLLKDMARSGLSKLFIQGHIPVSEHNLGEVLRLMFPPIQTTLPERPRFILALVAVLWASTKPDTTSWSVRHLELLLTKCSYAVTEAFMNNNGFGAVLRAAKTGDLDSGRLQVDCLRTLGIFIQSLTWFYLNREYEDADRVLSQGELDKIFQSDFFDTLCSSVTGRRWWLAEISGIWMPPLVQLCRIRPQEPIWAVVAKVFREFAERNEGGDEYPEAYSQIDLLLRISGQVSGLV